MVDVLELKYHDAPEGWKHIYRLANCDESFNDIPADTAKYLIDLAKVLLSAEEKTKHSNRTEFNHTILDALKTQAKLTRPTRGRVPDIERPLSDLAKSEGWKHAKAVAKKLDQNPLLKEETAYGDVANDHNVTESVILKAWKQYGPLVDGELHHAARDYLRLQASEENQLARLAKGVKSRRTMPSTVIPIRIPAKMIRRKQYQKIQITLRFTRATINDEASIGEILSTIALWNEQEHSPSAWNRLSLPIRVLISEKLLMKIER